MTNLEGLDLVSEKLEMNPDKVINWLPKSNKFQLMFLARNRNIEREMLFAEKALKSSNAVELLGVA